MQRVFNFSAGPATLPEPVLEQVQEELLDWQGCGASVMEISHRSAEFKTVAEQTTQDLRELLNIPSNYHVLFLPGGARTQFSAIPMNLLGEKKRAAYLQTGVWGKIAATEAQRYCEVSVVADTKTLGFNTILPVDRWQIDKEAAYFYYVDNETVDGVEFQHIPDSHGLPLVSDMSSNILSRPFDVSRFAVVFACAQKNIGPAGITVVILRDDVLANTPMAATPAMLRYHLQVEHDSMLNTAPTFPWYVAGLVFQWVRAQGGVAALAERNQRKADQLYSVIDASQGFYHCPVDVAYRSRMNVVFNCANTKLESAFLEKAAASGLIGLKGHRSRGGIRASIYNAMPEAGVAALADYMRDFSKRHG